MSPLVKKPVVIGHEPLWYKDAVVYQVHVKSFSDSNDDGIGDLKGLTQKLPYLKNLGVTAIWLLPFYPSPLKDDGYDIADYYNINPQYGTLKDFKDFLKKAHQNGLKVITELVINHTSDQHPWFKKARHAEPGSKWRDFYVWSESNEKYKDARVIFKDFELSNWTWDPVAKSHYWHRFYHHQPDLNFDSPHVQKEIFKIADYWFDMGVDGVRLDAIPYLFEREGTNCENLPETYAFLKKLRAHVDRKFKDKMFLAEANQWPEDAIKYFGEGDECHMAFHFPLMPRMYMALQMEDRFPITDILEQTPAIPESCQWAIFLRNHDELTLEMVTDEERDYMYRVYSENPRTKINMGIRRRLMPLLHNDRKKIELMNILLFSLLGTPIIYYGDEIGMGDNYYLGDRNGVRTPMQWSPDRNAGFSKANPQQLYSPVIIDPEFHYESINVETLEKNPSSILWWMRRVIAMRQKFKAFGRGTLEFLFPDNPKILSFIRNYEDETILVVINLSRFSQYVELDLTRYRGFTPKETFSQNEFPTIRKSSYGLTLGPHNHFWFELIKKKKYASVRGRVKRPKITVQHKWTDVFDGQTQTRLEEQILPEYLRKCRWFADKSKTIQNLRIIEKLVLPGPPADSRLLLLSVKYYREGGESLYVLPLSFAKETAAEHITREYPHSIIAGLHVGGEKGLLYDGVYDQTFHKQLLTTIMEKKKGRSDNGYVTGLPSRKLKKYLGPAVYEKGLPSQTLKAEQSNTSILYGDKLFLKLYRRLNAGINPDEELVRYLTEERNFSNVPPFAGAIEYRRNTSSQEPMTLCLLQNLVANQGDAWSFTLDQLKLFYDQVLSKGMLKKIPPSSMMLLSKEDKGGTQGLEEYFGEFYCGMIKLLGQRTAEMHLALGCETDDPNFSTESFSTLYQRSLYQSMSAMMRRVWKSFEKNISQLPENIRPEAKSLLALDKQILKCLNAITAKKYPAHKIRIHGDYHLGQVLFTGKDFMIIDFEGEPACSSGERRLKRSPLRDVAGMVRSFHYAAYASLLLSPTLRAEDVGALEPWADLWYHYMTQLFLQSYIATIGSAELVPEKKEDFLKILEIFLMEKAIYELGYELNNRPDWVIIPIRGIKQVLGLPVFQEGQTATQKG